MTGMTHNPGGKESFIIGAFLALKETYDVTFLADRTPLAYETFIRDHGGSIHQIRPRSKNPVGHYRDLRQLIRLGNFDVVWCHQSVLNTLAPLSLAKSADVSCRVIHSHATQNLGTKVAGLLHPLNRLRVGRVANRLFSCSTEAARWLFGEREAVIIPNAFDAEKYSFDLRAREDSRASIGVSPETIVISHVARFGVEKNHTKTLLVVKELVDRGIDVTAILVGDGELRSSIEEQVEDLRLTEHVKLLGLRSDVPELLQASDVQVLPSAHEGLPYSVLEAQAAQLPCVVSDRVPREVDVTGSVRFLALEAATSTWADAIVSSLNAQRRPGELPLAGTPYDIAGLRATLEVALSDPPPPQGARGNLVEE
ncbi:glycosyltransferase [Janibacter indicus]|uniref:glycosyltransferase n=1 Tax=Janibacter indicus TaxID=857417 RepID=UPI003EBA71B4